MASASCEYPLFASTYFETQQTDAAPPPSTGLRNHSSDGQSSGSPRKPAGRLGRLAVADSLPRLNVLENLPRVDDGPATELRARKQKLAFFERQCSEVAGGLFVGSEAVAKSRDILQQSGITHVVNCVGFLYPPYFEDELTYKTLYLQDTPSEDILSVMYDVFDFIEEAGADGRVLVHCSQGVSRSATLAIGYLMWKREAGYDEVFSAVKAARGVANPNIGFICQLLQWHKRRSGTVERSRVYRIAPQSASAPTYLVAKVVSAVQPSSLDPRGAFVVQSSEGLAVWVGTSCPEAFSQAAERFARQVQRYERAVGPTVRVEQGHEPASFWRSMLARSSNNDSSPSPSPSPTAAAQPSPAEGSGPVALAAAAAAAAKECSAYDKDFELYHRSLSSRSNGEGADSARSGKKTPRDDGSAVATSPNDRLRKHARAAAASADGAAAVDAGACGSSPEAPGVTELPTSTAMDSVPEHPLARSRSKSPVKSPSRLSRRQTDMLERGLSELERGISMDSAAQELERAERSLEEEVTMPSLLRAASDVTPPRAQPGCNQDANRMGVVASSSEPQQADHPEQQHAVMGGEQQQDPLQGSKPLAAPVPATGGRRAVPPINLGAAKLL